MFIGALDALRRYWREKSEKSDDPEVLPLGVQTPTQGVRMPGHRRHQEATASWRPDARKQ